MTVYTQRCKEAFKEVPVVIGGIEASLRRIAHYDYWSDKVRRSVIFDAKADILIYGNAERPLVEVAHRLAKGETMAQMQNIRGTAVIRKEPLPEWRGMDSRKIDQLHKIDPIPNPYAPIDVAARTCPVHPTRRSSTTTLPSPSACSHPSQGPGSRPMCCCRPSSG